MILSRSRLVALALVFTAGIAACAYPPEEEEEGSSGSQLSKGKNKKTGDEEDAGDPNAPPPPKAPPGGWKDAGSGEDEGCGNLKCSAGDMLLENGKARPPYYPAYTVACGGASIVCGTTSADAGP